MPPHELQPADSPPQHAGREPNHKGSPGEPERRQADTSDSDDEADLQLDAATGSGSTGTDEPGIDEPGTDESEADQVLAKWTRVRWKVAGHAIAVFVAAISLHLLMPTLVGVYSELDQVGRLNPLWLIVIVACQCASFWCMWQLMRVAIHEVRMSVVARAQLVGNAASLAIPGGAATGAAVTLRMLIASGVSKTSAVSALPVVSLLTTASVFASPVFALPAVATISSVPRQLLLAVWFGAAGSVLLGVALVVLLGGTRPIEVIADTAQKAHNRFRKRKPPVTDLRERLLHERDMIRSRLENDRIGAILATVGKIGFDYLSLLAALAAVGARPNPGLVLVAFVSAQVLRMIPITPGGLGFVEAGLTGALVAAGVGSQQAVLATAAYRVASYLLPMLAGAVAYVWARVERSRETVAA